jgi:adenosylcobinamide-GDP ribazoletransferase
VDLLAAIQFLTVLPIRRDFTGSQIAHSTAYFPIVGAIIGVVLLALRFGLDLILPASVANILLLATLAAASGGLHLDGLADTMDGMAGHRTPEQRLEIMRDSRVGGIGAVGLILFLIVEYVSLNSIPEKWMAYTLLVGPTASRWAMVGAIFAYPYSRTAGLGKAFKDGTNWKQFLLATVFTLSLTVALFRIVGLVIMAVVWLSIMLATLYFRRRLGGLTGDTYGAVNEIALTAVFITVVALSFKHWLL